MNPLSPLRRYNFIDIELSGDIPDEPGKKMLGFIGGELPMSSGDVERVLTEAERSENIRGVIIRIKTLGIGVGRANSIRKRLSGLKSAGKKIIVYLEDCGNVEYLLASVGDKIYVSPWATLNLVGLAAEVSFFKDTLSKLGINARIKGLGEYKSARDTFTRDSMSPAHREMMESILGSLSAELERAVAEGRGMSPGDVKKKIDSAPYTAKEAISENLVDGIAYEGDIRDRAGDEAGLKVCTITARKYNRYLKLKEKLSGFGRVFAGSPPVVAVLACTGAITSGSGRGGPGMKSIRSGPLVKLLGQISKDKSVRALVLRISSPGGSGIASDVIREKLKRISEEIPVVVSMSDVAASGGYLISLGARSIVADPMTLTGSIGIVYGKFDVSGLKKKLGISTELMPSSKHSLMYSSGRGFTEDEEKRLDEMLRTYYDTFVDSVSEGRNIDRARAEFAAGGRVWTGTQAKELGLVDELGGLHEAIELASKEAGIEDGKRPHVKYYSVERGLRLASLYGGGAFSARAVFLLDLAESLAREGFFAVMPYRIDIR